MICLIARNHREEKIKAFFLHVQESVSFVLSRDGARSRSSVWIGDVIIALRSPKYGSFGNGEWFHGGTNHGMEFKYQYIGIERQHGRKWKWADAFKTLLWLICIVFGLSFCHYLFPYLNDPMTGICTPEHEWQTKQQILGLDYAARGALSSFRIRHRNSKKGELLIIPVSHTAARSWNRKNPSCNFTTKQCGSTQKREREEDYYDSVVVQPWNWGALFTLYSSHFFLLICTERAEKK